MTILWCGGEDIDFTYSSYGLGGGDGTMIRAGISDGLSKTFNTLTSAWLHNNFYQYNGTIFRIFLVDNIIKYGIGIKFGINNTLSIIKRTSIETVLATAVSVNTIYRVDMQLINYGILSTINLFSNGVLLCSYSGDITIPTVVGFNSVLITTDHTRNGQSQIIIADTDTRLMHLKTLYPESAGTVSEWNGAYTDIDEVINSDVDFLYSSTANQVSSFNLNTRPAGTYRSLGLKISTRAVSGTSALKLQTGIRTGTTVYLSPTKTVGTYWETHEDLYQVNPVTGLPFTSAEIDSLQLAVKSIAT